MTRALIAALSPAMRAGLRALLAGSSVEVVGESAWLDQVDAGIERYEVLVVASDELLPSLSDVAEESDAVALVVLSDDQATLARMRAMPFRGWALLPLDIGGDELEIAIRAAASGLAVVPPALAVHLSAPMAERESEELIEPLTDRESEVLRLLSQGLPNKQIARALEISEHTVKFHVSAIFGKLDATSRTEAVAKGARYGLIVL